MSLFSVIHEVAISHALFFYLFGILIIPTTCRLSLFSLSPLCVNSSLSKHFSYLITFIYSLTHTYFQLYTCIYLPLPLPLSQLSSFSTPFSDLFNFYSHMITIVYMHIITLIERCWRRENLTSLYHTPMDSHYLVKQVHIIYLTLIIFSISPLLNTHSLSLSFLGHWWSNG